MTDGSKPRQGTGRLRSAVDWCRHAVLRLRRLERREVRDFRRWLERTRNLIHLSVLLFVPALIGLVTLLSNAVEELSFLLFPSLAAGTYTLFSDPESKYAHPIRFVTGLTVGALCGWAAVEIVTRMGWYQGTGLLEVSAAGAALAVFFTGAVTWPLDVEEPSAFSASLLALLVPVGSRAVYVASVFAASVIVATVFYVWREQFYEHRADFLYESTKGDDHVLVPMRGENPEETAMLAARLAAAHSAGKVVLLDLVDDQYVARQEWEHIEAHRRAGPMRSDGGPDSDGRREGASDATEAETEPDPDAERSQRTDGTAPADLSREALEELGTETAISEMAARLEAQAQQIETRVGVPCEVVVAVPDASASGAVLRTAEEANCDLVAVAYEEQDGALSPFVRELFRGDTDVVVHRSRAGRTRWKRVLVTIRRASDLAHSMIDFAGRLAGPSGHISAGTCLPSGRSRRWGEEMLADVVAPFEWHIETRVDVASIEEFLEENASQYDIVFLGASTDRSAASRFVSPPTFERIRNVDADVVIVDRGE
ncbi:MAG: HPP family protein [Haloarculaceae archaeon]